MREGERERGRERVKNLIRKIFRRLKEIKHGFRLIYNPVESMNDYIRKKVEYLLVHSFLVSIPSAQRSTLTFPTHSRRLALLWMIQGG